MDLKELLKRVASVKKRHEETARVSGKNFNIFNILNLTDKELIHSGIIAMLLDPKGEHGMGGRFLERFLEIIAVEECAGIDLSSAVVEREKIIEGGRLDIVITAKNKKIIIENKIHARDGENQLVKYHHHNTGAVLLYLTLDGKPSESANELMPGTDYRCISYGEHILKWLEACRRESENNTFLWGIIGQYILSVRELTGQSWRDEMNGEILDTLTHNADALTAGWAINQLDFNKVVERIINSKVIPALRDVAERNGLEFEETKEGSVFEDEYGFKFFKKDWGNMYIWFAFGRNLEDMGTCIYDKEKGTLGAEMKYRPTISRNYWNRDEVETLARLCNPNNDVIKEMEEIIKGLMPEADALTKTASR
ncbi:MAG: PD-(D/E)XK nuclease family protein [Treponema sp.]|nr:PD-(D/E)XK nuclease family protein [Treponema sp.]